MSATLQEIARTAGVSVSTASRALSRPELLRPETVARIRKVAHAAGYAPNPAAVALKTGRRSSLGLVLNSLTNPLYGRLARSIQRQALNHSLGLQIVDTFETDEREHDLLAALGPHMAGIISVASRLPDQDLRQASTRLPLLLLNRRISGIPSVVLDVPTGIARALDHLADLGHVHIAYVAGPIRTWSDELRRRRVRERARVHGLQIELVGPAPPAFHVGAQAADRAIETGATAIVAYNSVITLGALYRLAVVGIDVPDRMSVVSGDDMEALGVAEPAVTALHLPIDDAAREAIQMMLTLHAGDTPPTSITLPTTLIPRHSTGPSPW